MRFSILLIGVIAFTSCSKDAIIGTGKIVSETRSVPAFSSIKSEGSSVVEVIRGTQQSVEVKGYENLIPISETSVQNGTLVLKFENQYHNVRNNNVVTKIVVPALSKVSVNGSGDIYVTGFSGADFSAEVNGSGYINGEGCSYDKAFYKVNGSGKIYVSDIIAKEAEAEISGSGRIDLHSSQKLSARISGSGNINYWGSPSTVFTEVSGSGVISRK